MAELPNIRLSLANRPENVLLVREMLVGVAEAVGLDEHDLEDIRTAVSEACNNVVVHAYEEDEGPLEVELHTHEGTIDVLVRDHGIGLRPRVHDPEDISVGLGLPVIGALTHQVQFSETPGGGTEVRMQFATAGSHRLDTPHKDEAEDTKPAQTGSLAMSISPDTLARTVLPRVLSVLAAHARFSIDRIGDAQLLADELAAHTAELLSDGHFKLGAAVEPRDLRLWVGPLQSGGAQRLILDSTLDSLGSVIEKLADTRRVTSTASEELLALHITEEDPRR